jgi:hypothetical protein
MSEIKNEGGYTYIKDHGNWFQVDDNIDVDKIKGGEIFLLNGVVLYVIEKNVNFYVQIEFIGIVLEIFSLQQWQKM